MTAGVDADAALAPETLAWLAACVGRPVVSVRRFARAREAWLVDTAQSAGIDAWLLKGRRAPVEVISRSQLLSRFGAAREAAALRALAGTGVRVPFVGGLDTAAGLLLLQRLPGSPHLHRDSAAHRRAAVADYAEQLALLHSLDPVTLSIGAAIDRPTGAISMALGSWLAAAQADSATAAPRLRHAEPLLAALTGWLHRNVPSGTGTARLLHGDAGVANFLAVDGRVTGLLDWELAQLGDPAADLGNARLREVLYPSGTYAHLVGSYEQAAGEPVDRAAIGYYTVLAAAVLSLGMVANVHRPRPAQPEAAVRLGQDALARCVAAEAVCAVDGLDLEYDDPLDPDGSGLAPMAALLAAWVTARPDADSGQPWAALAGAVERAVALGPDADRMLLTDCSSYLGRRWQRRGEALAGLADELGAGHAQVRTATSDRIMLVLARDARRRLEVLAPLHHAEVWGDTATPDPGTGRLAPTAQPVPLGRTVLPPIDESAPARPAGRLSA